MINPSRKVPPIRDLVEHQWLLYALENLPLKVTKLEKIIEGYRSIINKLLSSIESEKLNIQDVEIELMNYREDEHQEDEYQEGPEPTRALIDFVSSPAEALFLNAGDVVLAPEASGDATVMIERIVHHVEKNSNGDIVYFFSSGKSSSYGVPASSVIARNRKAKT